CEGVIGARIIDEHDLVFGTGDRADGIDATAIERLDVGSGFVKRGYGRDLHRAPCRCAPRRAAIERRTISPPDVLLPALGPDWVAGSMRAVHMLGRVRNSAPFAL